VSVLKFILGSSYHDRLPVTIVIELTGTVLTVPSAEDRATPKVRYVRMLPLASAQC
jgi:hypothetical protein